MKILRKILSLIAMIICIYCAYYVLSKYAETESLGMPIFGRC